MINLKDVPGLENELQAVNGHIERLCKSNSATMQRMLDWVLKERGKQIRPILTLLCARLAGQKVDATETAAAIELCHTVSLIHDDIIDGADMRRGQLSVQKKFGCEMAVYTGDFMIFSTIGRTGLMDKPWSRSMFSKLEAMCDGEVGQFDNRYNTALAEDEYIRCLMGKTSAMFEIACEAGACEGKCNDMERKAVETFAQKFGLLFQLRDDLLDFLPTSDIAQKTIHNDFWCGYYTLPVIYTFHKPKYGSELKEIAAKIKAGVQDGLTNQKVTELIHISGGYQYTLSQIDKYAEKAKAALGIFQASVAKDKLIELVAYLQKDAHELK